ncbi:MAG: phosphomevalonate kinase [Alicyclobacillus sp.]|nr:phosphomevalonate kinase [Alicyclobacillus sp.]
MGSICTTARAPGKLILAGEYAVTEPGQPALVAAVNRFLTVHIRSAGRSGRAQHGWTWSGDTWQVPARGQSQSLRFVDAAVSVVRAYLGSWTEGESVCIEIDSELDRSDGRKYGLGSSAAVVVGVVAALLAHFGAGGSPGMAAAWPSFQEVVFKLSALAHTAVQGNGSAADVAAAVYGGVIEYTAADPVWIRSALGQPAFPRDVRRTVAQAWPRWTVAPVPWPTALQFSVGWTGQAASTARMLEDVSRWRARNPASYRRFLDVSAPAVRALTAALRDGDTAGVLHALRRSRRNLANLGAQSGVGIETPQLRALAEAAERFGGAGKLSGAGGGDCGIAVLPSSQTPACLFDAWRAAGIEPLDLQVTPAGVHILSDGSVLCANPKLSI